VAKTNSIEFGKLQRALRGNIALNPNQSDSRPAASLA
jgi:hypothetical protein